MANMNSRYVEGQPPERCYCSACGQSVAPSGNTCPECGESLEVA